MKTVTIKLPDEVWAQLLEVAQARGVSVASLMAEVTAREFVGPEYVEALVLESRGMNR